MKSLMAHKWIRITAAALSLSLIAAALDLVLTGTDSPFRDGAETVARPFLRLWAEGADRVKDWETALREGEALREENRSLRKENETLTRQLHAAALARRENARLRSLLQLPVKDSAVTWLPAWVLPRAGDGLTSEVTLDRGRADGVRAGQAVADHTGALLGLVRSAGEDVCSVSLLWDPSFRLTGQGVRSETIGILEGALSLTADRRLKLTGLTEDAMVEIGEAIVTFGDTPQTPGGLTVGTVTGIREDPGGLTRWAIVLPKTEHPVGEVFVALAGKDRPE